MLAADEPRHDVVVGDPYAVSKIAPLELEDVGLVDGRRRPQPIRRGEATGALESAVILGL
jgi:hypothetical protein